VVLRVGVVLSVTFNLPLRTIASADLRPLKDGHGDIALRLAGPDRIGYVHLWPHVRPWRIGAPEPMLRCLPEAEKVARLLTQAWAQAHGQSATQARSEAAVPQGEPLAGSLVMQSSH